MGNAGRMEKGKAVDVLFVLQLALQSFEAYQTGKIAMFVLSNHETATHLSCVDLLNLMCSLMVKYLRAGPRYSKQLYFFCQDCRSDLMLWLRPDECGVLKKNSEVRKIACFLAIMSGACKMQFDWRDYTCRHMIKSLQHLEHVAFIPGGCRKEKSVAISLFCKRQLATVIAGTDHLTLYCWWSLGRRY